MRSSLKMLVAAAATLLVAPQLAMAEDIETQLQKMNERMATMEQQLQATQDELESSKETVGRQQDVIEKAGLERQAQSGLSAFLSETQFSGLAAVSYTYNFNHPQRRRPSTGGPFNDIGDFAGSLGGGPNTGVLGLTAPHHTNANSFQLDQLWFGMKKPATAESRAGWGADILFGATAEVNAGFGGGGFNSDSGFDGNMPHVAQAYVEYLAPIGSGIEVKGGRWWTPIGAESLLVNGNFNVTRGLVWSMQPVNHTGVSVGGDCECGLSWMLAAANSYSATMSDGDHPKTFVGSVGWAGETFGARVSGLYGGDISDHPAVGLLSSEGVGLSGDNLSMIDLVFTFDPIENLSGWINFDYARADPEYPTFINGGMNAENLTIYAIATAWRLAITEALGTSIRYEWVLLENFGAAPVGGAPLVNVGFGGPKFDTTLWSITGTVDYALTENLTVLAEARYDWQNTGFAPDAFFISEDNGFTKNDQVLGLIQAVYEF